MSCVSIQSTIFPWFNREYTNGKDFPIDKWVVNNGITRADSTNFPRLDYNLSGYWAEQKTNGCYHDMYDKLKLLETSVHLLNKNSSCGQPYSCIYASDLLLTYGI